MNTSRCKLVVSHFNLFALLNCVTQKRGNRILRHADIPSPKGLPFIGTLLSLLVSGGGEKLHFYIDKRHKQYGSVFKETLGPTTCIFICDPNHIRTVFANEGKYPKHVLPEAWILYNKVKNYKRGLYFMDDEEWFTYRKIVSNILFQEESFQNVWMYENFLKSYYKSWIQHTRDGEVVDLEQKLYFLSLTFMISEILGAPFLENFESFEPYVKKLSVVVQEIFVWSVKLSLVPADVAMKYRFKSWTSFESVVNECITIASQLIDKMRHLNGDGILKHLENAGVPDDITNRLIVDFILAAGDTTATVSQWTLYLLGRHERIQEELYTNLKTCHNFLDSVMLKNVVKESMRLYPVAPFIARYLPHRTDIGGYLIEPNLVSWYKLNVEKPVGSKLNLITVPSEPVRLQLRPRT